MIRHLLVLLLTAVVGILIVSACASPQPQQTAAPDPPFPEFVYRPQMSLDAYRVAVRMPEVLRALPCYCNCGPSLGHRSLYDCFFKGDGTFDEHASTCAVCDLEAADAARWNDEGKSLQQIRRLIDAAYGAYGTGTDTPSVR